MDTHNCNNLNCAPPRVSPFSRRERSLLASGAPILPLLLIGLVSGCKTQHAVQADKRIVTDELGRSVNVAPNPQRIVSLAPSITETLFALGLADRIVGVTTYCDYPPEATAKEKVGDTLRPNLEKIVALRADLVVVSTSSQLEAFVSRLGELNIPVYVSNPRRISAVADTIERIGDLTGTTVKARELSAEVRERLSRLDGRLQGAVRPRVLVIVGTDPLITAGRDTFVNDLIERAGGRSISDGLSTEYPQFSLETAVASRPEVILMEAYGAPLPDILKQTPAARSGHVYHVDDNIALRPGPRIIEGVEQLAADIHPEIFKGTP